MLLLVRIMQSTRFPSSLGVVSLGLLGLASVATPATADETSGFDLTFERAIELHEAGSDDAALQIYASLLADRPADPRVLQEMAKAYLSSGDFTACIDVALRVSNDLPDAAATTRVLAECQRRAGRQDESLQTLSAALQQFPLDAALQLDHAVALRDSGRDAQAGFASALALAPSRPDVFLSFAALLEAEGQTEGAMLMNLRFIMAAPQLPAATGAAADILRLLDGSRTSGSEVDRLQAFVLDIAGTDHPALESSVWWSAGVDPLLAMADHDVLDTFLYFVGALARTEGSPEWLGAHQARFEKLVEYLAQPAT
jgi:tetratricopeptide (TPR) repeat protein